MALNYVTLTGTVIGGAGGTATFTPAVWLADSTDVSLIPPAPKSVTLDGNGKFSVLLLATDNAAPQPSGWTWAVTITGIRDVPTLGFSFLLPFSGGATQDLSALAQVPAVAPTQAYLPLPSGTPQAGKVPLATGVGEGSAWTPIGVPLKSGWWYPIDGGGGNRTMTYQMMWIWPFDCQRAVTLSQMAVNVTTAGSSGSVARIGVYASDGAGFIGNLLKDAGTVAADATGVKTVSSLATAAGPDRLWFCAVWQGTNGTAPVLQAYSRVSPYVGWSSFVQFPSIIAYQYTGISGALPATLGTPTGTENNNAPAIQFTVA